MSDRGLALDPHLPVVWDILRFSVEWRGARLRFEIDDEAGTFTVHHTGGGGSVPLALVDGEDVEVESGECWSAARAEVGWRRWERQAC